MEGLHQLFDEQEVAVEDTYSGYQSSKLPCFQQLDQHSAEADLFISASARDSDMSIFQQPQQLSHLSSSYSEDDLAQAADVVTADLDAVLMGGGNSTPPPALQPGAYMVAPQQMQPVHLKQEHSGVAGSSCGACSPQASCDTHSKAQQFWAAQQYDAAYNLVLAHSPVSQYAPAPMHGTYGSSAGMGMAGAPCAGPCCYPGSFSLMPQGSGSMPLTAMGPAQPQFDYSFAPQSSVGYAGMLPSPAGAFGSAGPAAAAGMVPHAAFGTSAMANTMVRNNSAPSAAGPSLPQHSMQPQASLQRAHSSYPAVQGGVQKRQSGSGSGSAAATEVLRAAGKKTSAALAAEVRAARKSADGSCSSKDGSAAPPPRPKKAGKASTSTAAAAAASAGTAGRTSRGSASAAVAPAAPAGAAGSAAVLIKELQQEIETLTASKAQLKSQVRTLLTSQTDLLSRVATLTTKWQQAVAENAALHRQNLQLASQGL